MGDAAFTPDWARHAVWYQILPERFANGDPANDPPDAVPWDWDWYTARPGERVDEPWPLAHLSRRRYGGDLAGVRRRLPYLQDLGVNAIYLNPVFDAPSHHKYDASTLHHVDVHLGPDPAGDRRRIAAEDPADPARWVWTTADRMLLELVDAMHERGMRIILDGVFNHVGRGFWAFRDLMHRQRESRYAPWFKVTGWADEPGGFRAEGWRDHATLPEFRQEEGALAEGPRRYVEAITRRWMAPDGDAGRGVDGWRLDVAPWLPHRFWKDWRRLVRSINPEAYLTAENIRDVAFNRPFLEGDEFDAVMNYNFAFACDEFFFRDRTRITASRFDALLRELREAYPACVAPVMQNLFGSHDTARLASHAMNRDALDYRDFDASYHPRDSRYPLLDVRPPDAHARALQRLFVFFQMTHLGAPMIYYGDECGMWGANDPCCRQPMPAPGDPRFDADLRAHYRACIALRHAHPVLRTGAVETLLADDARELLVHRRVDGDAEAIVAINRSEAAQAVVLAGRRIELAPLSGQVLTP